MQAVIIAGGKGTRMGKASNKIPKILTSINNNKTVLDYQIKILKKNNVKQIIIIGYYLSNEITKYILKKKYTNIKVFTEPKLLGTAGGIKLIYKTLKNNFFVIYGDLIFKTNLSKMYEFHKKNKSHATILVHKNDHNFDSDLVKINKETSDIISFFREPKNKLNENYVNAAIYIIKKKVIKEIDANKKSDFIKDFFPKLLRKKYLLKGFYSNSFLYDMGTINRLKKLKNKNYDWL